MKCLSIRRTRLLVLAAIVFVAIRSLLYLPAQDYLPPDLNLHSNLDHIITINPGHGHVTDTCTPTDSLQVLPATARKARCTNCQNLTCAAMLFNDVNKSSVYAEAKKWMTAHPVKPTPDEIFINDTNDCKWYREARGYHMEMPSEEEAGFPIAYNLIVHHNVPQIERLLRAIYRPQNEYCIHLDAKQRASMLSALRGITGCFPNVHIASKLEYVVYAGFSRLQADINCMDDLLNKVTTKWKYLINIAGQSFPLKTNLEMVQTLKVYNGSNDIEGITGRRILRFRFKNEYVELQNGTKHAHVKATGKTNPKPPYDIEILRGSAYGIFSRAFVKYVLHDKRAKALLDWSRKTWSPDEHYWATLHHLYVNPHLKTPGGYPGKPDDKPWLASYSAWTVYKKCHGKARHFMCIFGVGDLPSLFQRREFFINKFQLMFQPFALDCIEEWLEYKVRCPQKFDHKYYESLPFVQHNLKPWYNSK